MDVRFLSMLHLFPLFVPLFKRLFPKAIWRMQNDALYLTFDDGPHPKITPKVLALLKAYEAKATFFVVGEQAEKYPEVIAQIIEGGHALASHSHKHLNAWKHSKEEVLNGMFAGPILKNLHLYRPPYGRYTRSAERLVQRREGKTILWSHLSLDYDARQPPSHVAICATHFWKGGDVVVFHDSEKAKRNMLLALRHMLEIADRKKKHCAKIDLRNLV